MADQQPSFWARLKQHHIYRVAAWYGATIALLIQVVARAFPYFGWSEAVPAVIIILIAGFPVALMLAWLLGEPADTASQTNWQQRHRKLGAIVIPIVIAAVVVSGIFAFRFSEQRAEHLAAERAITSPTAASVASVPAMTTAIPAISIAVLPFQNLSGDPNQAYFSDGITEEILNALAQIPDLKVAGRTSAFQFASKDEDVRKVGAILGVATVLEGSVQKAGDEVRITAQLIDTKSGYQLWSEQYDRKLTSIFAVEDDISNAIMGKLKVQWNGAQPLVAQQAIDPRAHDFYLRGLTLFAARGKGLRDAVAAFQSALNIDLHYADAWGAMGEALAEYPDWGLESKQAALPRALAAAQRALALDPDSVSAHVALGMIYRNEWQWAKADAAFQRALALAPNDAEAIDQYAQLLLVVGQLQSALAETERAQRLDPLAAVNSLMYAYILNLLHRYTEAWQGIQTVMAAHPDFASGFGNAIHFALALHRYADAERLARQFAKLNGLDANATEQQIAVIQGLADPKLRARGLQTLETAPAWLQHRDQNLVGYAAWLMRYGERDRAVKVLERVPAMRADLSSDRVAGIWDPVFDPIRDDPRFKAVLKKMGLPYKPTEIVSGE